MFDGLIMIKVPGKGRACIPEGLMAQVLRAVGYTVSPKMFTLASLNVTGSAKTGLIA